MKMLKIIVIGTLGVYDTLEDVLGEQKQFVRQKDVFVFKNSGKQYIGIVKKAPTTKKANGEFRIPLYKIGNEIYVDLKNNAIFQKNIRKSLDQITKEMFIQKIDKVKSIDEQRTSGF